MRILLLLEATLGGTARHILDLASGLLDSGNEVHLIYSVVRADDRFLEGLAALRASQPHFYCQEISIHRQVGFSDIPAYFQLVQYVRRQNPFDVFHAHSTKAGFLLRLVVPRNGAALVYTPHGLMTLNHELTGFARIAVCALESSLARLSDAVIAVSEAERRCAIETGVPAKLLSVIHNGLNFAHAPKRQRREAVRSKLGLSPDTICITSIGLLVPNKEHGRLLDAFALLLSQTIKSITLLIIGWGPLESELRAYASALGIQDSVRFLGQVSGIEYLPAVDVLAHTSRYEAFGYVFLEALSAGIPVVTTRVGSADELVESGMTGDICDPWNAQEFASYLQRYVEDPELRKSAAPAARARAERSNATAMVASTLDLYRDLRQQAEPSPNKVSDGAVSRTQ